VRKVRGRSIRVGSMSKVPRLDVSAVPVDCYRTELYSPDELYDATPYADSLDGRAYAWAQDMPTPSVRLAQALHDYAIDEALTGWLSGRHLVGVMGGHDLDRSSSSYADAARLGQLLGQRNVVATGGGPGAMEAANLGAFLAAESKDELGRALQRLAEVPSYRSSIDAWVASARAVSSGVRGSDSLGIPTWFYGQEPPNLFATAIAKYFRNATREAILLQICDAGIVFLPGAGGTVQEIFQDACENYYATAETVAPMVLVGEDYWTGVLPAWPLLVSLARGRPMESHIHLVETVDEAAEVVAQR
jgi:predicted Rossmann-fold nucleotide-binding protein